MQAGDQSFFQRSLHIFILAGIAVAYPLLHILTKSVAFFIAGNNQPIDLIFLSLALTFLFPSLLVALVWLARPQKMTGKSAYLVVLFILVSAMLLPALKTIAEWPGVWMLVLVAVIGTGFIIAYTRNQTFRRALTFLSPVILIIPALFLFNPRVRKIVWKKTPEIGQVSVLSKNPVLMILFDEFPLKSLLDQNGNIDAHHYPNFARLAERSTWYRNATTVSADTMQAVPAILTGNYPKTFSLANKIDHPRNLFTLFNHSPYVLSVHESATNLSPDVEKRSDDGFIRRNLLVFSDLSAIYLHHLLPADFVERLPAVTETWRGFWRNAPNITNLNRFRARDERGDAFGRFVASIKRPSQPHFYFLHIMLPHVPWQHLPSGRQYNGGGIGNFGIDGYTRTRRWINNSSAVDVSLKRHLMQVEFVDKLLGNLMEHLDREKLFEPALIVIVSDHGASFRAGEFRREITNQTYDEVARVPLFIKRPFQKSGMVTDVNAQIVDVFPTMLQELGIQCDWKMDGHSLIGPAVDTKWKTFFNGNRKIQVPGEWKSIGGFPKPMDNNTGSMGKRLTDLKDLGKSPIEIHLHNAEEFMNVRFRFVPALVTAHVEGLDVRAGTNFGIVVNGVIRATARPFQFNERSKLFLSAVVPEDAFQHGSNQVEIVLLPGAGEFLRPRMIREKAQPQYE